MGGKAKWRKLKRVVGPMPQGTQAPAKQHLKKERTKTRDSKRRRIGDAGEEDEDEADAKTEGSKKELKSTKDPLTRTSSKKGQDSSKSKSDVPPKCTGKVDDNIVQNVENLKKPESTELLHSAITELAQETNGIEEPTVIQTPGVLVTDLDKDFDSLLIEGLQKPTSEEILEEELRKATEETDATEVQKTPEKSPSIQKATQTDAVNINNVDKPVKFFISDDSDSDTAIFVDANQVASNGANGQLQEYTEIIPPKEEGEIEISAVIDVGEESIVEVTVEGQDIEFGIEEACASQTETENIMEQNTDAAGSESPIITQLIDVETSDSPKPSTVQRARILPSLAHPVKPETQKRYGQTKFPFDHLVDGDNISRSSASDSVDTVSMTRSSVSDPADQDNISKTSNSESADQDGQRKCSMTNSVELDSTSVTSANESVEHETVSKVSITESIEQETMTVSTAESIETDFASKLSTVESADPGTLSKSSTRGSIDQDIISKSSASESGDPDAISRTSVSESVEQEVQSKTSYSEYEEAEGITRTSASESGEPDSMSRTSVSESGDFDRISRTSVSESVEDNSKASMSVTGTSVSATGEYSASKSSVNYSSEFDAESLSSTADLLTPKEETSFVGDIKAEPGIGETAILEKESPDGTPDVQEKAHDRPISPAWEELNLEDHIQLTEGGVISEETMSKGDKEGNEADAESLFFSLYPEYQPGEVDESQEEAKGNPKVLCFRGQTQEQGETQEEVYMAAGKKEEPGTKEGRNKGTVSGKIHQLQRKLSQQKKFERENKEVAEFEGFAAQQDGGSAKEQQDTTEQKLQGNEKEGESQPSTDSTGRKSLPDVPDSSTASITSTIGAKKTEHTISKKKDDLVCLSGQFREGIEKLENATEFVTETITDFAQNEGMATEVEEVVNVGAEAFQEVSESESKMDINAKDRKTLVGKARDWIKGVTRMGGKKDDTNGKGNDKIETKKVEADIKSDTVGTSPSDDMCTKEEEIPETGIKKDKKSKVNGDEEKEESVTAGIELLEEGSDKQIVETNGDSDIIKAEDNEMTVDNQTAEVEGLENLKNADKVAESEAAEIIETDKTADNDDQPGEKAESKEKETGDTENNETPIEGEEEKAETEATKEFPVRELKENQVVKTDENEPESKEEDLFTIVGPDEELSDSVFKDDTGDENGKAKDSDGTEVQDIKAEESPSTEEEKTLLDKDVVEVSELMEKIGTEKERNVECKEEVDAETEKDAATAETSPIETEKQETEETMSKDSEASFVSVQEGIEPEVIPAVTDVKLETASGVVEKQKKSTKDELKPRRKRHEKSKSPSVHKDGCTEESTKVSKRDKEGKGSIRKRRHRRRTKSQEDGTNVLQPSDTAQSSEGLRPEDVPLPADDFENEREPSQVTATEDTKLVVTEEKLVTDKTISRTAEAEGAQEEIKDTTALVEKKRASSKSSREKKHSKKSEDQLASETERKRHSRSRREKSAEPKQEKQDAEISEKSFQKTREIFESPREKLKSESEVQSSVSVSPATWSPRVGRRDRKCNRKTSECKQEDSFDKSKVTDDMKDGTEFPVPTKETREIIDDDSFKQSPKPIKKIKSRKPDLSINITEPRDDTPIPSPKGLSQQFKIGSPQLSQNITSTGTQPLIQTLTFPPGVSKPISPLPQTKELKFPPGVSKPLSPLPQKTKAHKPIPAPLKLKPDVEPANPVSPLNTLTFPEGISKPISPLPKKVPPPLPKPVSSLDVGKPLLYPAKPVSPLKMLHFPEGIPIPISPLPKKSQEPSFASLSPSQKDVSSISIVKEIKEEPPKPVTVPEKLESEDMAKPASPKHKKPRPRITIPKVEPESPQTLAASPEPVKTVSPLKTLKFPVGISQPVSPLFQKNQQPLYKVAEKTKKIIPEDLNLTSDSSGKDLPMRMPAIPVSPLRQLTFPVGIPKPISPTPEKGTQPIFKPLPPTKPIPPALGWPKSPEKSSVTDSSSSVLQSSKPSPGTLTVLTFPEGVSKPISPLPHKTKFPGDIFKATLPSTKASSPTSELIKQIQSMEEKPKPSEAPKSTKNDTDPSLAQDQFFKTVHPGEKPPFLMRTKPSSQTPELLKVSDSDTVKSTAPDHSGTTTFIFPEGVSMPVSPLPVKVKSQIGTSETQASMQKEQADSTEPSSLARERHTVFTFAQPLKQTLKPEEFPKPSLPDSPTTQKVKASETEPKSPKPFATYMPKPHESISPSPIKIKHTVDFPSDTFPCTKASSPLIRTLSSPTTKSPSPSPKASTPTFSSSTLPKTISPVSKIAQTLQSLDTGVTTEAETSSSSALNTKLEPKIPKSILSTRLKSSPEATSTELLAQSSESIKCPLISDFPFRSKFDSLKTSTKSPSPDRSPKPQPETTKSTISQTHLTYSEVSKRFTPSPRLDDETSKEISATPPMTPPPQPEQTVSAAVTPKEYANKVAAAMIQTSEVRSAARYSRGEYKSSESGSFPAGHSITTGKDSTQLPIEERSLSTSEVSEPKEKEVVGSSSGVRRLRELHQSAQEALRPSPDISRSRQEDVQSTKDGYQSPHSGCDSPSKKMRRRKRR